MDALKSSSSSDCKGALSFDCLFIPCQRHSVSEFRTRVDAVTDHIRLLVTTVRASLPQDCNLLSETKASSRYRLTSDPLGVNGLPGLQIAV